VSQSRLQLAQQALETERPKIRVAVLGLNVQDTARRIVRLLLADALESEQGWESQLLQSSASGEGVLIRYGDTPNPNLPPTRTSMPILNIPASVLERSNVEILVSSLSPPAALGQESNGQTVPADTFLAPAIGTPTAASGRQTMISQPVHSTLVVLRGLDELLSLAELLASTRFGSAEDRASIRVAMEQSGTLPLTPGQIILLDAKNAEDGLAAIRRSIDEATTYEHKWVSSGMPALSTWLSHVADPSGPIPMAVRILISSLLSATSSSLQEYAKLDQMPASSKLSLASRTNLESSIDEFSRNAHSELQSGLSSAWSSRNWRKLAWYKLFWRVDDVGLIISDLINNAWLPRTERAVYELSGRLSQAGISPVDVNPTTSPPILPVAEIATSNLSPHPLPVLQAQLSVASAEQTPTQPMIINAAGFPSISMIPTPQPTPLSASISITRTSQISNAITSLSHTAQQLVFRTLSITGFSGGLSALTYVSLTPGSLYEAGTIVALGTAFALYRMQGSWQRATKDLEDSLFNEGRKAIQRVAGSMRELVEVSGKGVDEEAGKYVVESAVAVEKAKAEFDKVIGNGQVSESKKIEKLGVAES
jgi:hypothetical protein